MPLCQVCSSIMSAPHPQYTHPSPSLSLSPIQPGVCMHFVDIGACRVFLCCCSQPNTCIYKGTVDVDLAGPLHKKLKKKKKGHYLGFTSAVGKEYFMLLSFFLALLPKLFLQGDKDLLLPLPPFGLCHFFYFLFFFNLLVWW